MCMFLILTTIDLARPVVGRDEIDVTTNSFQHSTGSVWFSFIEFGACLWETFVTMSIVPKVVQTIFPPHLSRLIANITSADYNILFCKPWQRGTIWRDDVIKWKRVPRYWPFVRGIHRSSVNSAHKGQWRGALMFSLICAWRNGGVNNGDAGDLRRHRAQYGDTVMRNLIKYG